MIISHKHQFIFLKTGKTAGTSIEMALSKICGEKDIITKISRKDEKVRREYAQRGAQHYHLPVKKYSKKHWFQLLTTFKLPRFYNHMTAGEVRDLVPPEVWNNYFKFTIERNPFDKIVSLYYWRGRDKSYRNVYDFLTSDGLAGFNSFDIYAINGVVAVDKIYRYEQIESFLADLTQELKLKESLELPSYRAKSKHRKESDYRKVLDDRSVELIKTIYAREIRLLGYEF